MGLNQLMILVAGLIAHRFVCAEFTFELQDKDKMCFYETIHKDVESVLDYMVVVGGNQDVDVEVKAPNGQLVYAEKRKTDDTFVWKADFTGVYSFCFSNEFSSFAHKFVAFQLDFGEDNLLGDQEDGEHAQAMTLMEAATKNIHGFLSKASSIQTHFRNREAGGRHFAEGLNLHVILWSLGETIAVLVVGLGQVLVLRSFFSGPSPRSGTASVNGRIST